MTVGEMVEILECGDADKIDDEFVAYYHDGDAFPILGCFFL